MNVFYEESGGFKVGAVLEDHNTSLQVEAPHGKRAKIKANAVLLRFEVPLRNFMEQAHELAEEVDVDFLWACCAGREFAFSDLGQDYFGHPPSPVEAAGLLLRLHGSPMYFYKKGSGRYKAAPEDALKAALASRARKRDQALKQAAFVDQLSRFTLPAEFPAIMKTLLYKPDKSSLEFKAVDEAAAAAGISPLKLLEKCGAVPSSRDYHLEGFLFQHFPRGVACECRQAASAPQDLEASDVRAFSIDDATTTEIDDAFSLKPLANGNIQVGIHIAAPALGIAAGSEIDVIAAQRLSTVYMPGAKITMLPDEVIACFTLAEKKFCPALSLYLEVKPDDGSVAGLRSVAEKVEIAANLRHDTLERDFNEEALSKGHVDFDFGPELRQLWELATRLESARGKPDAARWHDYNFHVANNRVTISERRRGTPIDKVVSELMIFANTAWGKMLADNNVPAIYRVQSSGKVKMSTVPVAHEAIGAEQYAWVSSPLRRYVDLVNQRQLIAWLRHEPIAHAAAAEDLFRIMQDFETAYDAYNEFQRGMERYWCLRWLIQEGIALAPATVLREGLVRIDGLPLVLRTPSLPELAPGTRVQVTLSDIDLLELAAACKYRGLAPERTG